MSKNKDDSSETQPSTAETSDVSRPDSLPESDFETPLQDIAGQDMDSEPSPAGTSDMSPPDSPPKSDIEIPLQEISEQDVEDETQGNKHNNKF